MERPPLPSLSRKARRSSVAGAPPELLLDGGGGLLVELFVGVYEFIEIFIGLSFLVNIVVRMNAEPDLGQNG
jgi:hypothetical protein